MSELLKIQMQNQNALGGWDKLFPLTKAELVTTTDGKTIQAHVEDTVTHITEEERTAWNGKIDATTRGQANGVATLDGKGLIPITQIPPEAKESHVVTDISARDLITELFDGLRVTVIDASADETVSVGGATYVYYQEQWHKVSEEESMDLVIDYSNIIGKPTSPVADIDDAVTKRHVHTNKTVIDDIADVDGKMTYKTQEVAFKTDVDEVQGHLDTTNLTVGTQGEKITVLEGSMTTAQSDITDLQEASSATNLALPTVGAVAPEGTVEGRLFFQLV